MCQENERVSCQFYNDNFTPSGHGRARAIVNTAGRAWDRQATVCHKALQCTMIIVGSPYPVHTWGNCFQNPSTYRNILAFGILRAPGTIL